MLPPADYFSSICLPEVLSSLSKKKKKNHQIILSPDLQNIGLKKKKKHQSLN